MKIIRSSDAPVVKIDESCLAREYDFGDGDINSAVIELKGRSPEKGWVVNEKVKELVHVIKGSGKLCFEASSYELGAGDEVLIDPGEKYYFEGEMTFTVPCTPSWNPEQQKHIE